MTNEAYNEYPSDTSFRSIVISAGSIYEWTNSKTWAVYRSFARHLSLLPRSTSSRFIPSKTFCLAIQRQPTCNICGAISNPDSLYRKVQPCKINLFLMRIATDDHRVFKSAVDGIIYLSSFTLFEIYNRVSRAHRRERREGRGICPPHAYMRSCFLEEGEFTNMPNFTVHKRWLLVGLSGTA